MQARQASGVSRISARGVLKVRPDTKTGGGGGGGLLSVSGPIRNAGGGGVCCRFLARYERGRGQARIQNVLEGGAEKLARKFTPILGFILETVTEGGARAP